jgi:hypothetical protein
MSDLSALKPDLGRCGVWTALVGAPTEWITPQQAMDIERLGYRALWVEPLAGEADKVVGLRHMQIPHRGALSVSLPVAMRLQGSGVHVENRCARYWAGMSRSAWVCSAVHPPPDLGSGNEVQ